MLCYGTFLKCCANLMFFGDVCNFVCIFCGICWFWGAGGVFGLVFFGGDNFRMQGCGCKCSEQWDGIVVWHGFDAS